MAETPNRPPAAATGRLSKTPVLHLLVYAHERRLQGTLELTGPEGEIASVLFLDGQPTKARTTEPMAYLGRVVLELGYVSDGQLNQTLLELARTKRLHGQILLEAGLINEGQLDAALKEQLVQKLRHLLTLPPETSYSYYDGFDSLHTYGGDDQPSIDPFPVVWAAVREAPPWEHVHAALTRVSQVALRMSSKAQLPRFGFQKAELELLDLLRTRPMRVSELVATGLLKPREAQLLAYCLLITKQLQVVQEGDSFPPRLDSTPSARPAPLAAPPPIPEATINATSAPNHMSFSLRAAMSTLPGTSSPPPARIARDSEAMVAAVARMTPPPPQRAPSPLPPGASPSPVPSKAPSGPPSMPPSIPPSSAPRSSRPPSLARELLERRDEILARVATIDREDYFVMLDLDRDATVDQVREKFFALAKAWHPDRLPPALAGVREACGRVFSRMSEAHQTLADEERRGRYMNLLKDGGATPESQATIANVVEAATNFQKAEICLKRSDMVQAEALVKKAMQSDPDQPEYLALAAWLQALKPENQTTAATAAAIAQLDRAIQMSNRCERAFFYRGQLHKRSGNAHLAVKDFRKAAELNPRNIDAAREVRLYEMRLQRGSVPAPPGRKKSSTAPEPATKPGLFGKLFKK